MVDNVSSSGQIGDIQGVAGITPKEEEEIKKDAMVLWLISSSIQPSNQTVAFGILEAGSPTLVIPNIQMMQAEIGAKIWDEYLEVIKEQADLAKKELREWYRSPEYAEWREERGFDSNFQAKVTEDPTLMSGVEQLREKNEHAISLWSDLDSATQNLIQQGTEEAKDWTPSIVMSSAAFATMVGAPHNIVDVASTDMVTVNPIQDANINFLPLVVESNLKESFTLTVNLFAVGAYMVANLQAIGKAQKGEKTVTEDAVIAFATEILDKVEGNLVNAFLMNMIISKSEGTSPVTENRMQELATIAKIVMLSVALTALYTLGTGWITPEEFLSLINGEMKPEINEENPEETPEKVKMEIKLVEMFQALRKEALGNGIMTQEAWDNIIYYLAKFMKKNPSAKDLMEPTEIWINITKSMPTPELGG